MLDKIIVKNISSLFSIRIAGYLIPLITLPYLVRVLEPIGFGLLGFSTAILQYCIIFVSYGFDLNCSKKIAENNDNKKNVSEIFWNVIIIRITFSIIGFIVLYLLSFLIEELRNIQDLIKFGYVSVIGAALFPQWLFQGKEQLGVVSTARIVLQLLTIPLLLTCVKEPSDVWIAALFAGLPSLAISIFSFYIIYKRKWVLLICPSFRVVKRELIDSWHLFVSSFVGSLYLNSVPVILGFVSGPASVAIYVSAYKLFRATQGLYSSISGAYYPRINALYVQDKTKTVKMINHLFKIQLLVGFFITIFLFVFSSFIVDIVFGHEFESSATVLKILSPLPIIIGIGSVLGVQTLLVFGYKKELSFIYVSMGALSLVLIIPLSLLYDYIGASVAVLCIESLVTFGFYIIVKMKGIPILNIR